MIRNERGFLTVDFIFAIVMIMGFTALLFVVSITLTTVSVTQYVTFAAARNYTSANIKEDDQISQAKAKFKELTENKVFKPLYKNGWFSIEDAQVGDHTKIIDGYAEATQGTNEFWGVSTQFTAKVLDFHIPFFGDSAPGSDGSGSGFKTIVGSYLGREPTTQECLDFTAQRWNAIRNLPVSSGTPYSSGTPVQGYFTMTDDGC
jgi:hypothetical protein